MSASLQQWIHRDSQLAPDAGVTYELRYVGAMPVLTSIKSVDLSTRTQICRASIRRVCEDVGLKLTNNQPVGKSTKQFIGPSSDIKWAMTNVYLTITSQTLTVETLDTGMLLFQHNLFLVSFASAGDGETLDFICYVAKTDQDTRMCYVFECPGGLAQDVIITIGQAFQLGYQKSVTTSLSRKAGALMRDNYLPNNNNRELIQSVAFDNFMDFEDSAWLLENEMLTSNQADNMDYCKSSCDAATTSAQLKVTESTQQQLPKPLCTTDEVNNRKSDAKTAVGLSNFDHLEPVGEPWYVGKMSRSQAENLLRYDGDFLVRASIQQPGQFVLSGLQDGKYRHLLLADPNGKVRTKERVFDSIQHLIDYHVQNGAPIRSLDSEIKLIFPVSTHTFCIT